MRSEAGFSLIELIVVLAIFAALSMAATTGGNSALDHVRMTFALREVIARIYNAERAAKEINGSFELNQHILEHGLGAQVQIESLGGAPSVNTISVFSDQSATPAAVYVRVGNLQKRLLVNELDGRVDEAL